MRNFGWSRSVLRSFQGRRSVRATPEARESSEQGQAIIEIALALPVIAAFTFMMIELCLAFYSFCMISESAREGTRYAIVRGATCQTSAGGSCTASASTINS